MGKVSDREVLFRYGLGRVVGETWDPAKNADESVELVRAIRRRHGITTIIAPLHPEKGFSVTAYLDHDDIVSKRGESREPLIVEVLALALRKKLVRLGL